MAEDNGFAMGYALGQDNNSNNGGFGGMFGEGLWAIIILAMLGFGGGYGGFGGFGGGVGLNGALTRAELYDGFATQNIDSAVRGVQQGICDSTYALTNTITNGFHGVDSAVCNLGYNVQSGFNGLSSQLAQCCCDNRAAIADVKYQMATDTCAIQNTIQNTTRDLMDNQNAGTRAILDFLTQDKISTLTAENQSLKFAASQAAQNAFITANQEAQTAELIRRLAEPCPVPAYVVPNPNCCYDARVSFANGCGTCASF